jgi:hypothetical protein
MTLARAALKTSDSKRIVIELYPEQRALIGHDELAQEAPGEKPDFDLGSVQPSEQLEGVVAEHATLTYRAGDFWIEPVDGHEIAIGKYEVVPGHPVRVVEGDTVRFGHAEFTFHILKLAPDASPVARGSVEKKRKPESDGPLDQTI